MVIEVDDDHLFKAELEEEVEEIPWSRQPVVGDSSDFSLLKKEEAEPTA